MRTRAARVGQVAMRLVLALCSFAGTVVGEPAQTACPAAHGAETAASLKQTGDSAMQQGDFEVALACYNRSYQLSPDVRLLYNQARALEFLKRNSEAFRTLREFSRSASPELKARIPQLEAMLEAARSRVAIATVRSNVAGAKVLVDDNETGTTPLEGTLILAPGVVTISVRQPGYEPFERTLELSPGQELVLDANLTKNPVQVAAPVVGSTKAQADPKLTPVTRKAPTVKDPTIDSKAPQHDSGPYRTLGWTALGVGAAGVVSAVVTFALASSARDDICGGKSSCEAGPQTQDRLDKYDNLRSFYTASWIMAGTGLIAGGVLLWQTSGESSDPSVEARVGAGSVQLRGSF